MEKIVKKQSMGRQKIQIKKIEKKSNLQVAFSKRRRGLFKKVEALSKECGVDAAVLVESPGGKLFDFATPSTEHIVNRYLGLKNCESDHHNNAEVKKLRVEEGIVKKQSEEELKRDELVRWNKPIDVLGLHELEEFKVALEGLKSNILARANLMSFIKSNYS